MKTLLLLLFGYSYVFGGIAHTPICCLQTQDVPGHKQQIPVFDKEKQYPKKTIKSGELIAERRFIPLETTPEVLLDNDARLTYVSDKRILVYNQKIGNIFIFGIDGKALLHFNGRGPDSYNYIVSVVYDEKNKEVFILDLSSRIYVYSENGVFRRILHTPDNIRPTEMYNFDDQSILIFDEKQYINTTPVINIPPTQPFTIHSKKNGAMISKINITMNKVLAKRMTVQTGPNSATTHSNVTAVPNNSQFGPEFIFSDFSLDTIYHLKEDKTLVPMFVQSPSVFSDHPKIVNIGMLTDRFVSFSVYTWDILEQIRNNNKGQKVPFNKRYFMYDFHEENFYEINLLLLGTHDKLEISKNMCAYLIEANRLVEDLKAGRLTGELKRIVQKLNEEDNPVVELVKYK